MHKTLILTALLMPSCVVSFASAEEYQSAQDVSFTFSSTIGVTVSSNNLTIGSLVPGNYSDSNIITVTATSNAVGGYQLNSTVGNTTYNYTDLRISSSDTSHVFNSLGSSSASSLANLGDSKWGYSYSTDSGSTWRSGDIGIASPNPYGGYTSTSSTITHVNTTSPGSSSIQYKIGAKTSATQAAGTYQNVVNFAITAKPEPGPPIIMQEATLADCGKNMIDSRDQGTGIVYTTALIGDQCWMTTNLNLAGGTALSAEDTNVTSAYISSFTTSNRLTKTGNTIVLPNSSTSGFNTNNYSYVYNSGKTGTDCSSPGCFSYYSWDAATLGSGRAITTSGTDADYSICPKGWHLPNTRNGTNSTSDFRKMVIALGGSAAIESYDDNTSPTGTTLTSVLQASPYNYLRTGFYRSGSISSANSSGYYLSSTSLDSSSALIFTFTSNNVRPSTGSGSGGRGYGFSVRCVLGD